MIESKFRAAVDAATDGLAITDSEGCYTYLNPAHVEMFGYDWKSFGPELADDLFGGRRRPDRGCCCSPPCCNTARGAGRLLVVTRIRRASLSGGGSQSASPWRHHLLHPATSTGAVIRSERPGLPESRLRVAERSEGMFSIHNSLTHDFGRFIAAIDKRV